MKRLIFPNPFPHAHPPVQNVNKILEEQATKGQRAADWVATAVGSWRFIVGQSILLVIRAILTHLDAQNEALVEIHQQTRLQRVSFSLILALLTLLGFPLALYLQQTTCVSGARQKTV